MGSIYETWKRQKNEYEDYLGFVKFGDFYITFNQDAEVVAETLHINIGTTNCKRCSAIPVESWNDSSEFLKKEGFIIVHTEA